MSFPLIPVTGKAPLHHCPRDSLFGVARL